MSSDLFIKTVQTLEQHPDAIRIKKLIFSLCNQYWENDLTFINRFSLRELLQDLIESKPTLDELSESLDRGVKSLNRSQIYAPIAQVIIQEIAKFYPENGKKLAQPSHAVGEMPENRDTSQSEQIIDPLEQVVSTLFQHPEKARIQKLLCSVYSNRWEKTLKPIKRDEFQDLILKIHQVYNTLQDLNIALITIVETINKPVLYRTIAHLILNAFEPLYGQTRLNPNKPKPTPLPKHSQPSFETQIIPLPPIPSLPSASLSRSSSPPHHQTTVIDFLQPKTGAEERPTDAATSLSKTYDLFELRQMIMQYTNPLWAKILLFSVLIQPWDVNNPDWSRLRSQTLDDLIEQLILRGMRLPEVETKLQSAAIALSETDDPVQAASTLIEAIKPFVSEPRKRA